MSDRKKLIVSSIGILTIVSLIVAALTIKLLYDTAVNLEKDRLVDVVRSHARIIESIAGFDKEAHVSDRKEPLITTVSQVRDAYSRFVTFGRTGEVVLARREGDSILFLLRHFGSSIDMPEPVPFDSHAAEPMRRALSGQSGWVIGADYRGETVLAAYEPVKDLGFGIVAKTDLSEVREPFIRAGAYAAALALLMALLGSLLYLSTASSMIRRIEEQAEKTLKESGELLRLVIDSAPALISYIGSDYRYRFTNKAYEEWFGHSDATGKQMREVLGEEAFDTLKPYVEEALSGRRVNYESFVEYKAGGPRFIEGNYIPHINEEGQVEGFVVLVNDLTERKRMEEELRKSRDELELRVKERTAELTKANLELWQSEERLRFVLEGSQLGFWDWNIETGEVKRNERWAEMLGYTLEEIESTVEQWTDLHHPDDRNAAWKSIENHLQGLTPVHEIEYRMRTRDGSYKWILDRAKVVKRDSQGKPIRMSGSHTDITERKQMEEAVRRSEEKFSKTFRHAPLMMTLSRVEDGAYLEVNERFVEVSGFSREEAIGKTSVELDWISEKDRERLVGELKVKGSVDGMEITLRTKEGRDVHCLYNGELIDTETHPILLSIAQDITELKRAQEVLRNQAALLDLAHDAILVRDLSAGGRILYWNKGAEEMYGWSKKETLGEGISEILKTGFPESLEEIKAHLFRAEQWEGELVHNTKAGERIIVESRWALQRDDTGSPCAILEINRDITDRKRAEEDLKAYASDLERSNRELEDFAFITSHDLQEPLRKIQVFSERISTGYKDVLDDQCRDWLERIQKAAHRMRALIDDLLRYSRLTTRKESLGPVSLKEPIEEAVMDLRVLIEETGGRVEMGDLPTIEADAVQMRQLFQNLIGNALKFHGKDSPEIKIHCSEQDAGACRIFVEDKGIGFDEKYLERIFTPFQRLHGPKSPYKGAGMGLAICRKIVERHGGAITARSSPGRGATFIITLPLKQQKGERHRAGK